MYSHFHVIMEVLLIIIMRKKDTTLFKAGVDDTT